MDSRSFRSILQLLAPAVATCKKEKQGVPVLGVTIAITTKAKDTMKKKSQLKRVHSHFYLKILDAVQEHGGVRAQPAMAHDPLHVAPLGGVWNEHHSQKVSCVWRDIIWKDQGRGQDVVVELIDVVAIGVGWVIIERKVSCQHCVKDDTTTPNVDSCAHIKTVTDHKFGCSIARRSTGCRHQIPCGTVKLIGKSKVCDHDVAVPVKQQILLREPYTDTVCFGLAPWKEWDGAISMCVCMLREMGGGGPYQFEITMNNVLGVKIVNSAHELCKQPTGISFFEVSVRKNVVKEFAA